MIRPFIDVPEAMYPIRYFCSQNDLVFDADQFAEYCQYIVDWNAANYQLGVNEPTKEVADNFYKAMHWLYSNADALKEVYEACSTLHDMDANVVVAPFITTVPISAANGVLPILKAEYEYLDPDYQLIHPLPSHYVALIDLSNIVADFYHRYYKLYAESFMVIDDNYEDRCKEAINALKPNPNYIPKEY